MSSTRAVAARTRSVVACAGLVCMVIGTFLPWFRSGSVQRNSYETAALVDHFALFDNPVIAVALRCWAGVPLLSAICFGLYVLGISRTAATLTLLSTAVVGTTAGVTVVQGGGAEGLIGVVPTGTSTTIVGAAAAAIGALGVLVTPRGVRSTRTGRVGVQP
jgi:hypothetical protein